MTTEEMHESKLVEQSPHFGTGSRGAAPMQLVFREMLAQRRCESARLLKKLDGV